MRKRATPATEVTRPEKQSDFTIKKPPAVTGQCAQVLNLIREHQSILSFTLTADYAIPEAAARVCDLRGKGFNVVTTILPEVEFRGRIRKGVALYSLGTPEWRAE